LNWVGIGEYGTHLTMPDLNWFKRQYLLDEQPLNRGARLGEIALFASGTSCGKSTIKGRIKPI